MLLYFSIPFKEKNKEQIKFHNTILAWKHICLSVNVEYFEFFIRWACRRSEDGTWILSLDLSAWKKCRFNVWCTRLHIISLIRVILKTYFLFCAVHFTEYSLACCIVQFWCQVYFFLLPSCCIMYMLFETFLPFAKQILNLSRNVFPVSLLFFLFHLVHIILLYFFNAFSHYLMPRFFTRNR